MSIKDKKDRYVPIEDRNHTFEDDHDILTYRPDFSYIEPEPEDSSSIAKPEQIETIDSVRDRTKKVIDKLNQIATIADALQKRVDNRVANTGNFQAKLDPLKDQNVIAAMKRRFPNRDSSNITYQDYKDALDCIQKHRKAIPDISDQDLKAAAREPLRTDFGGSNNQQGENRPELGGAANVIDPVDQDAFQNNAVIKLFNLMKPLIKDFAIKLIKKIISPF